MDNLHSNFLMMFVFSKHWNLTSIVDLLQLPKADIPSNCYWQKLETHPPDLINFLLNFLLLVPCTRSMIRQHNQNLRISECNSMSLLNWLWHKDIQHSVRLWYEYMKLVYLYCGKYILSKWRSLQHELNSSSRGKSKHEKNSGFFLNCLSWVPTAMIINCLKCIFRNTNIWVSYIHITPSPSTGI